MFEERGHLEAEMHFREGKRWIYWVPLELDEGTGELRPVIVFENVPGFFPLSTTWGNDYHTALGCAEQMNKERGITPEGARAIIQSSMFPRKVRPS